MARLSKKSLLILRHETPYQEGHQGHDSLIGATVGLRRSVSREDVVTAFVSSLSTQTLNLRSALGSYAVGRNLDAHPLDKRSGTSGYCAYCGYGGHPTLSKVEADYVAAVNTRRYRSGSVCFTAIEDVCIDLQFFLQESKEVATTAAYSILKDLLRRADRMPPQAKLSDLVKAIKDVLPPSNASERRGIIEILGMCGVLQPEGHPSYLHGFIPAIESENRRKQQDTDWLYPVQWWRGKDRVNREAVRFWFKELDWE
jgi:hypothetical protein